MLKFQEAKIKELGGCLHEYAIKDGRSIDEIMELESKAWEQAVVEKYGNLTKAQKERDIAERLKIARSLYGSIPADITLEEAREERINAPGEVASPRNAEQYLSSDTLEAIAEVAQMKKNPAEYPGWRDVDRMMEELLK